MSPLEKLLPTKSEDKRLMMKILSNRTKLNMIRDYLDKKSAPPREQEFEESDENEVSSTEEPTSSTPEKLSEDSTSPDLEKDNNNLELSRELSKRPDVIKLVQTVLGSPSNMIKLNNLMNQSNSTALNLGQPIIEAKESLLVWVGNRKQLELNL